MSGKLWSYWLELFTENFINNTEKEAHTQEYARYCNLSNAIIQIRSDEIEEYLLLFVQFFKGVTQEELDLAKAIVKNSAIIILLFSRNHSTAWKLLAQALYRDGKLFASLNTLLRTAPLPSWAESIVKEVLKADFSNFSYSKGIASQELTRSIPTPFTSYYINLLAEAGAEVFTEGQMPSFIPQATREKIQLIEKELAKEKIVRSLNRSCAQGVRQCEFGF